MLVFALQIMYHRTRWLNIGQVKERKFDEKITPILLYGVPLREFKYMPANAICMPHNILIIIPNWVIVENSRNIYQQLSDVSNIS